MPQEPLIAKDAVLKRSEAIPEGTPQVKGYDFNNGINYTKLFESYVNTGFQATNLGLAIKEINRMVRKDNSFIIKITAEDKIKYSWIVDHSPYPKRSTMYMKPTNLLKGNINAPYF